MLSSEPHLIEPYFRPYSEPVAAPEPFKRHLSDFFGRAADTVYPVQEWALTNWGFYRSYYGGTSIKKPSSTNVTGVAWTSKVFGDNPHSGIILLDFKTPERNQGSSPHANRTILFQLGTVATGRGDHRCRITKISEIPPDGTRHSGRQREFNFIGKFDKNGFSNILFWRKEDKVSCLSFTFERN